MKLSTAVLAAFLVVADAVEISSPRENDVWSLSEKHTIKWETVDTDSPTGQIQLVNQVNYPPSTVNLTDFISLSDGQYVVSNLSGLATGGYQIQIYNGGILAQSSHFNLSGHVAVASTSGTSTTVSGATSAQTDQSAASASASTQSSGGGGGGPSKNKILLGVAIPLVVIGMSALLWFLLKSEKGSSRAGSLRRGFASRASHRRPSSATPSQMSERAPTFRSNWSAVSDPVPPYEPNPFEDGSTSNLMSGTQTPVSEDPFSDLQESGSIHGQAHLPEPESKTPV